MSKIRLVSFFLIMFVFLTGSVMLNEVRGDHFDSQHIIYYGHSVVDVECSHMDLVPEHRKCELYRDGDLVHTWFRTGGYWSDTVTWGVHTYQAWLCREDGEGWGAPDKSQFVTINSNNVGGIIHNSDYYQNELGRGPVNWSSGTYNLGSRVWVVDGTLNISSAATVVMNDFRLGVDGWDPPGALEADGATFIAPEEEGSRGKFMLDYLDNPTTPVFQNCTFSGPDFLIQMDQSQGVQIVGNNFTTKGAIYVMNGSTNCLIQANTADSGVIGCSSGGGAGSTIRENVGMGIKVVSSDVIVIGNQAPWIAILGHNNTATNNDVVDTRTDHLHFESLSTLSISGTGNLIKDNTITELIPNEGGRVGIHLHAAWWHETASGNTIETNTVTEIVGIGISANGPQAFGNLIKKNNLLENLSGIVISNSSSNNLENNACNENLDTGLELTGDSYDNAVAFNHIWGGISGIVVGSAAHGNGFHENKVEYNDVGIYTASRNNYIYNNIFRRNLTNAFDDGVTNTWNRGSAVESPNIVGGPYLGGNYWDDYKGADSDGDGIGETPYAIFGAQTDAVSYDNLPLIWDDDTPPYLVLSDGDYNGDGSSDIAIFRDTTGLWAVRGVTRVYFGGPADEPVSGDYNGDGTTDISIFRRSTGLWAVRAVTHLYFGDSTDTSVPGDYNGDGSCDPGIFRESWGLWAIRSITRTYFGQPLDKPVPGNYSGAGLASIAIFRPSAGLWSIHGLGQFYFGSDEDLPADGDYNGNGTRDLAIFRRSEGLWAVAGITRTYFGGLYDRPLPADYDGDSATNIALFREMSGLWAVRGVTRAYFGGSSDLPVSR